MSDRPEKRMVEFIESYWTGGELGADYQWNDNHGELVRCKDCTNAEHCEIYAGWDGQHPDWFCADGKRRDGSNDQVSDRVPGRMGHHGDYSEDRR